MSVVGLRHLFFARLYLSKLALMRLLLTDFNWTLLLLRLNDNFEAHVAGRARLTLAVIIG